MSALYICIPAWGRHYVDIAERFVVPSILAALKERDRSAGPVTFMLYTDAPRRFSPLLVGHNVAYRGAPAAGQTIHQGLTWAHRDTLARAPEGATVALLNADIVISRETFAAADILFQGQSRVIASLGVRSVLNEKAPPPIGGSAAEVFGWAWRYRHPIISDLLWGEGRSSLPTMLFFAERGSVVCHCFHMHPFLIRKDRTLDFRGTVDDDLLARYGVSEIYVARDFEAGFAEISLPDKQHQSSHLPLSVQNVVKFGTGRLLASHLRSFGHKIRIVGNGNVDDEPARAILIELNRHGALPTERPERPAKPALIRRDPRKIIKETHFAGDDHRRGRLHR